MGEPQLFKTDALIVIAAAVMEEFMEAGHGDAVLEALYSGKKLKASDVAGLQNEPKNDETR